MGSYDYGPILISAQNLLTRFGRTVTLVKLSATAADPALPWRGPTDPAASPAATQDAQAVFVAPSSASALGISSTMAFGVLLQRATALLIVGPGALPVEDFHEVIDGTRTWRILGTEKLQPGPDVLLYFVGVAGK